ncbi:hypothetical protein D3C71_1855660 [compost metagenome]
MIAKGRVWTSVLIKPRQGWQRTMGAFILQAGQQDPPIGQFLNLAACGFKAAFELPGQTALGAKAQIR